MKAALYARVSLDKQRENYSIPTQLAAMREYCIRNIWGIVKEYVEDESGAKLIRPILDQVREDVAAGLFDVLVCYDVDRLGRNLGHQILLEEEFARHGVEVRYVLGEYKDNPEGRLTKHIKGVIAEYEREKIIERTFRGRLGRAKAGQVNISSREPYGYVYKREERRGWLEVILEEADIVKEIYRLYVQERLSFQEIAAGLTNRQVPTRAFTSCEALRTITLTFGKRSRSVSIAVTPESLSAPVPITTTSGLSSSIFLISPAIPTTFPTILKSLKSLLRTLSRHSRKRKSSSTSSTLVMRVLPWSICSWEISSSVFWRVII